MTTSPVPHTPATDAPDRVPLRLGLRGSAVPGHVDGAWWPQSRDLHTEAADLVDHFPGEAGRINRMLFSRPDWDDGVVDGRGLRRVTTARGPVKVGSFPGDDTHEMVLMMASGAHLHLVVVPWDTSEKEARGTLRASSAKEPAGP